MQVSNTQPNATPAYNPSEVFAGPLVLPASTDPSRLVATPTYADMQQPVDEKALHDTVKQANEAMKAGDEGLEFTVHKGTNRIVVKLVDHQTNQVLREFPSEKFLDMMAKLQQVAGLNVNLTT